MIRTLNAKRRNAAEAEAARRSDEDAHAEVRRAENSRMMMMIYQDENIRTHNDSSPRRTVSGSIDRPRFWSHACACALARAKAANGFFTRSRGMFVAIQNRFELCSNSSGTQVRVVLELVRGRVRATRTQPELVRERVRVVLELVRNGFGLWPYPLLTRSRTRPSTCTRARP